MKIELDIKGLLKDDAVNKEVCNSAIVVTDNGVHVAVDCKTPELMCMYFSLIQAMANVMHDLSRDELKYNIKMLQDAMWDVNGFVKTPFGIKDISKKKEYIEYRKTINESMEVNEDGIQED